MVKHLSIKLELTAGETKLSSFTTSTELTNDHFSPEELNALLDATQAWITKTRLELEKKEGKDVKCRVD